MKKSFALFALSMVLSSASFAAVLACGQIERDPSGRALLFTQTFKGQELPASPIYSYNPRIAQQLPLLVGFREVCVMVSTASRNEGDTLVTRLVSYNE